MTDDSPQRPRPIAWLRIVRDHPVITSVMVVCMLVGAVLGFALLTEEWSAARRILSGVVSGAGVGMLIVATKIIQ